MTIITFRNSKIVYYGPHSCENCGVAIVKMGTEWGGTAFTNPQGPIYPNTEWHPHVCDPKLVKTKISANAQARVLMEFPAAVPMKIGELGYVIVAEATQNHALGITTNQCFHDTIDSAWAGALDRMERQLPAWHIDLNHYKHSRFTDDLERLPECPAQ